MNRSATGRRWSSTLRRPGSVPILRGVNPLRRALGTVVALGLFALWLVPDAHTAAVTPTVHGVQASPPAAAALEAPPVLSGAFASEGEAPTGEPETHRPTARPPAAQCTIPRRATLLPDGPTRARSAGPIYRVLRSGQAHRSAP